MKTILILIPLLLVMNSSLAQESFSTVEERMTGKEFMATGLNKLTDAELEALNNWLRDHSVATLENRVTGRSAATTSTLPGNTGSNTSSNSTTPAVATSTAAPVADERGFEGSKSNREDIVSRLVGEFTGWDGETVFTLENGMIWKQEESDYMSARTMMNPEITIKSGMFGSWRLKVEGYNKSIEVIRIQ